jgi:hypothetical protein
MDKDGEVLMRSETMFEMTEGKKTARVGELMHWLSVSRDLGLRKDSVKGLPIR